MCRVTFAPVFDLFLELLDSLLDLSLVQGFVFVTEHTANQGTDAGGPQHRLGDAHGPAIVYFTTDDSGSLPILLLHRIKEFLLAGGGELVALLDPDVIAVDDLLDLFRRQRLVGAAQLVLIDDEANDIGQLLHERATQRLFTEGHGIGQSTELHLLIIFLQDLIEGLVLSGTLCQFLA